MRYFISAFLILTAAFSCSYADFQPLKVIEVPTAGVPPHGGYVFDLRQDPGGRLTGYTGVAFINRFYVILGYGGGNIIGEGDPDWNPYPFIEARFRIFEENIYFPAVAVGYSSFGYGSYERGYSRFDRKPSEFYLVGSKAFAVFDYLGLHGGLSFEPDADSTENAVDIFAGGQVCFERIVELLADYRFALNDMENDGIFGEGRGYLNAGLKVWPSNDLSVAFYFINVTENGQSGTRWSKIARCMEITYEGLF
ncbi:hypothetical protein JXA84_01625 [candidate division WOR-3 bacterium]|nr:hypothetical protein [candidate division WOR-3 bacterium]